MRRTMLSVCENIPGYEITHNAGMIHSCASTKIPYADSMNQSDDQLLEETIGKLKEQALKKLKAQLKPLRCNAMRSVRFDVEPLSLHHGMLVVVHAQADAVHALSEESQDITMDEINHYYACMERYVPLLEDIAAHYDEDALWDEKLKAAAQEIIAEGFCSQLLEYMFHCVKKAMKLGFPAVFAQYFECCDSSQLTRVFFAHMHAMKPQELLEFRTLEGFKPLIQSVAKHLSYEDLYAELKKEDDYMDIVILHPLLEAPKYSFTTEEIRHINKIISRLKSRYYHASIELKRLSREDKICRCGRILIGNSDCGCGSRTKINQASYQRKLNIIARLEKIRDYANK